MAETEQVELANMCMISDEKGNLLVQDKMNPSCKGFTKGGVSVRFAYQVIRSSRKTIALQISPAGKVIVRCPQRMRNEDIRKFVESKSDWVEKHLSEQAARPQLPPFTHEEMMELSTRAAAHIPTRAAYFAPKVGVTYGRITIRNQRSRWGSCSGQGNLNFNCLLMLVPPEVLDYVVVHELCHRKEMNHSDRFWAEVEKILPDYRERRKWLKDHGDSLIGRLG